MFRSFHILAAGLLVAVCFAAHANTVLAQPAAPKKTLIATGTKQISLQYQCRSFVSRTFQSAGSAWAFHQQMAGLGCEVKLLAGSTFNEYIVQYRLTQPKIRTFTGPDCKDQAAKFLQNMVGLQFAVTRAQAPR